MYIEILFSESSLGENTEQDNINFFRELKKKLESFYGDREDLNVHLGFHSCSSTVISVADYGDGFQDDYVSNVEEMMREVWEKGKWIYSCQQ